MADIQSAKKSAVITGIEFQKQLGSERWYLQVSSFKWDTVKNVETPITAQQSEVMPNNPGQSADLWPATWHKLHKPSDI